MKKKKTPFCESEYSTEYSTNQKYHHNRRRRRRPRRRRRSGLAVCVAEGDFY